MACVLPTPGSTAMIFFGQAYSYGGYRKHFKATLDSLTIFKSELTEDRLDKDG